MWKYQHSYASWLPQRSMAEKHKIGVMNSKTFTFMMFSSLSLAYPTFLLSQKMSSYLGCPWNTYGRKSISNLWENRRFKIPFSVKPESCWEKICKLEATSGWSCVVMVSLLLAHVKAACAMTMVSDVPLESENEQVSKEQSRGNGLAEGAVKELKRKFVHSAKAQRWALGGESRRLMTAWHGW